MDHPTLHPIREVVQLILNIFKLQICFSSGSQGRRPVCILMTEVHTVLPLVLLEQSTRAGLRTDCNMD